MVNTKQNVDWIIINFRIRPSQLKGCHLVYVSIDDEGQEGSAHIIFIKDRKLFEVNAAHCSCVGFEDQWQPEETTKDALRTRESLENHLDEIFSNIDTYSPEDHPIGKNMNNIWCCFKHAHEWCEVENNKHKKLSKSDQE